MNVITQIDLTIQSHYYENPIYKEHRKIIIKDTFGLLVKHKNKYYIITQYNIIRDNIDIHMKILIKDILHNISLKEYFSLHFYDFSLLELVSPNDGFILDNILYTRLRSCIKLDKLQDISSFNKKYNFINFTIIHSHILSQLCPPIPLININIDHLDISNISNLFGGNTIMSNNSILGLITHIDKSNLNICPMFIVNIFFNQCIKKKLENGFCFDTSIISYDKNKYAHIITDTHNITYSGHKQQLSKHDIIMKIDGNEFNENGQIYVPKYGCYLDFHTFVILANKLSYKLNYAKYIEAHDSYTDEEIKIKPVKLYKYMKLNLFHTNIYNFNNFLITELSEELFDLYSYNSINLTGLLKKSYDNYYTNQNNKILVIIKINNIINIPEHNLHSYNGFQYIESNTDMPERENIRCEPLKEPMRQINGLLPIIYQFNNNYIKNMDEFKYNILSNKSKYVDLHILDNNKNTYSFLT